MSDIDGKTHICQFCGNIYSRTYEDDAYIGNHCFDCSYWLKKAEYTGALASRRAIIGGEHYLIGIEETGPFKGHGGRKFTILFQDGRIVETSNLWYQGEIPERFREMLPDNAVFIPVKTIQALPADDSDFPF